MLVHGSIHLYLELGATLRFLRATTSQYGCISVPRPRASGHVMSQLELCPSCCSVYNCTCTRTVHTCATLARSPRRLATANCFTRGCSTWTVIHVNCQHAPPPRSDDLRRVPERWERYRQLRVPPCGSTTVRRRSDGGSTAVRRRPDGDQTAMSILILPCGL